MYVRIPATSGCSGVAQASAQTWSRAQNGRACAPAKNLKPRPFPVKIYVFRVCMISLDVDQPKISMQAKKLML